MRPFCVHKREHTAVFAILFVFSHLRNDAIKRFTCLSCRKTNRRTGKKLWKKTFTKATPRQCSPLVVFLPRYQSLLEQRTQWFAFLSEPAFETFRNNNTTCAPLSRREINYIPNTWRDLALYRQETLRCEVYGERRRGLFPLRRKNKRPTSSPTCRSRNRFRCIGAHRVTIQPNVSFERRPALRPVADESREIHQMWTVLKNSPQHAPGTHRHRLPRSWRENHGFRAQYTRRMTRALRSHFRIIN